MWLEWSLNVVTALVYAWVVSTTPFLFVHSFKPCLVPSVRVPPWVQSSSTSLDYEDYKDYTYLYDDDEDNGLRPLVKLPPSLDRIAPVTDTVGRAWHSGRTLASQYGLQREGLPY